MTVTMVDDDEAGAPLVSPQSSRRSMPQARSSPSYGSTTDTNAVVVSLTHAAYLLA